MADGAFGSLISPSYCVAVRANGLSFPPHSVTACFIAVTNRSALSLDKKIKIPKFFTEPSLSLNVTIV